MTSSSSKSVEANEPYLQQEEPSSEDEDLEANIVIVAQQV